jgi:uncharacterized protein (DUF1330 family)
VCRIDRSGEWAAVLLSASALSQTGTFFSSLSLQAFACRVITLSPTRYLMAWSNHIPTHGGKYAMTTKFKITLAVIFGAALGAAAIQGLHAQTKLKAYTVTENEALDAAALAAFVPAVQAAQRAAGGRPFRTGGGKVVAVEGAAAPKRVAITEWDSLEQAQAFYNSAAWKNILPQRDKAAKTIRMYIVEATN